VTLAASPFVLAHLALAPSGPALDVACGTGRHALAIARTGRVVHAFDRDVARLHVLARAAEAQRLPVRVACVDLETMPLPAGRYALIVNTLYLDRLRMPMLCAALAPGGLLLVETFTVAQAATGHPRNPAFLLEPNELRRLVGNLQVLAYEEGAVERDGTTVHLAAVAARQATTG
jgi:SAM-dependent methyltransferase